MTKSFKKQTIAVNTSGRILLMEYPDFGYYKAGIVKLIGEYEFGRIPAGIYIGDILYTEIDHAPGNHVTGRTKTLDIDICYQLAEYRDKELYSGEVKLT